MQKEERCQVRKSRGASGYLTPIEDETDDTEKGEEWEEEDDLEEKDEDNPLTAPVFEFDAEGTAPLYTTVIV